MLRVHIKVHREVQYECKTNTYQFNALDAHFDYLCLFGGTQAEKVGHPKKNCENCIRAEKTKYCAMKFSQIRQRIELCMREIILRFEMNL
jgi:hypothetical protein